MEASSNKLGTMRMGPLIFTMALPAILSMLMNAIYNIVDSIFVAQYAQSALTAVSLVFPLQQLVVSVGVGTGIGVNSLIARRLGAGMHDEAEEAGRHGLVVAILSAAAFVLLDIFASRPFLAAFSDDAAILKQAIVYSHTVVGCSCFVIISMMCEKIQQSTGNMVVPMVQLVVGSVVNIILDPLMIFGIGPFPEMGVLGAGVATVIGQLCGMLIGLWGIFVHQKQLSLSIRHFKWQGKVVKEIYEVGLPSIVMQSIGSVMLSGLNAILIGFSDTAVSVFNVYFKLETFVFMPVFGLNQGALPVIGYNYGARNRKRMMSAYGISTAAACVIMLVGLLLFQTQPEHMMMLFVDRKDTAAMEEMLRIGVPALKIISFSFLGAGFGIINSMFFQAVGHGVTSLVVSVCRQLGILLPVAWLLGRWFGLEAVWYSIPFAEAAAVVISFAFVLHIYRKELRHLDQQRQELTS